MMDEKLALTAFAAISVSCPELEPNRKHHPPKARTLGASRRHLGKEGLLGKKRGSGRRSAVKKIESLRVEWRFLTGGSGTPSRDRHADAYCGLTEISPVGVSVSSVSDLELLQPKMTSPTACMGLVIVYLSLRLSVSIRRRYSLRSIRLSSSLNLHQFRAAGFRNA